MLLPRPDNETPFNHNEGRKEYTKHLKITLNDIQVDPPKDQEEKMSNELKPGKNKNRTFSSRSKKACITRSDCTMKN